MPKTTRKRPSLGELADRFESAVTEKKDLESRLSKTLGELDGERSRLNSEITTLRYQVEQLQRKNKSDAEEAIRQRAVPGGNDEERSRLQQENTGLRAMIEQLQKKSKTDAEDTTRQRKAASEFESERSR